MPFDNIQSSIIAKQRPPALPQQELAEETVPAPQAAGGKSGIA
jgi:hypothetical protein